MAAKLFDPVGYITPFIIRIKILMQAIWKKGLDWDQELPSDLGESFKNWCAEVYHLDSVCVNRPYLLVGNIDFSKVEIHVFCDASLLAYGAVAYFKISLGWGKFKTVFIMSKSRVAPLKELTLPRLELMGCVIGTRVANYLVSVFNLNVEKLHFWADSSIALHWIKGNSKDWKPFVSNRVQEIQSNSNPKSWNFCKGKENPADLLTRGVHLKSLPKNSSWWHGPGWLSDPEVPSNSNSFMDLKAIQTERRSKACVLTSCVSSDVIDVKKFSRLERLYRVTAWTLRFVNNAKCVNAKRLGPLSAEELENAERFWVKSVQDKHYSEDVALLKSGLPIRKESSLYKLNPGLDESGLLCLKGRLQYASLENQERHPWILPARERLTELLVMDAHHKMKHLGVGSTITEIRQKFWIIKGRQFVKSVIKGCLTCKRFSVRPGQCEFAPLPADRVQESKPFSIIGCDFAGPLYVKDDLEKRYILLFTCAVTRAVHIELVNSLSTSEFLLAFRRFIGRRGLPTTIYSDNAKTFKSSDSELKKLWTVLKDPDVLTFYGRQGIRWKYIAERAAWWGGFWERMIRTVKTALRKILGKTSLSTSELETVLVEIESVVNSRPITFVYNDPNEPSPISPSHFLVGERLTSAPPCKLNFDPSCNSRKLFVKKYNYREKLLEHFWKRWRKEYLLLLRSFNTSVPQIQKGVFKVGEIVLIGDEKLPRNMWKLGKVIEVFPGRDNKIRSVKVKHAGGCIRRPIQLIYPLEVSN